MDNRSPLFCRQTLKLMTSLAFGTLGIGFFSSKQAQGDETVGIETRVPWVASNITGSPNPPSPYRTEQVFSKLQFTDPVDFANAPGTDRLFVVELQGNMYSFLADGTSTEPDLFIDLKAALPKVDRVYGLTFHPNFQENRYCYICYITGADIEDGTRVSRFEVVKSDPPMIDPTSEQIVLTWRSGGHNGGCLKFGPDGCLYISTGDGGPAFPPDPMMSGQDVSNVLACILRVDVDRPDDDRMYSIPSDNPYVDLPGARGEIWSYGHRNPWRMSFDSANGDLWVGDVGWELWELVYRIERGANYGWSLVEGLQPVHRERTRGPSPIVEPTAAHSHIEARSVTGGYVYRGERLSELRGCYVYGDYVTGKMWALRHDGTQVVSREEIVDTPLAIICFGVDNSGELYVVGYDGTIHRLVENGAAAANASFPTKLSDTGLFTSVKEHAVAAGVIPYSINAEPWMDGASAERYIALPGTARLGIHETNNVQVGNIKGNWSYPTDAVLMKTISLEMERGNANSLRRLETQILHYDVDTWRGYTYAWNDEQTDAELSTEQAFDRTFEIVDASAREGKRQQTWHFASSTECLLCHTTRGGSVYGFVPSQLDRQHRYGDAAADQLATLQHIGVFDHIGSTSSARMANPQDESASLEERARAYLHINCAHCHRRGGGGTAAMDVQHQLTLEKTNLLKARPTQGTFGIHGAEVLGAGDPYRSVLLYRMSKLGRGRMPYIGSSVVDDQGVELLHDWIASLKRDADNVPPPTRTTQLEALNWLSESEAASDAASELLTSTSGAIMAVHAINDGTISAENRDQIIQLALKHEAIQIRDLFERFLPEEKRTKRLGASIDPEEILNLSGDTRRGSDLFLNTAGVQCKNCHQVGKQGKAIGPELTQIGKKYNREQLLESLLFPSKRIDPKFVTQLIETTSGQVVTGLLIASSAKEMVLKDAQAKEIRVPRDEIDFAAPQQKSMMPDLLLQDLTAQQVADLLAFLDNLR
ncbi:MAG: PQQ-dependent sugar dehydrogenase [Planctomycetes bacterium]|nr:PQQ-dependent sugar dehydrogenase [Planctomycetota bacterium]